MPISSRPRLFFFLFLHLALSFSSPPEDPIRCSHGHSNCTITNSYGVFPDRTLCQASKALFPTTEEELVAMVASATKNKSKMKVATRSCHSLPKLICPEGEDGLVISTKYLNRIVRIDVEARTMTVESGVTLKQLIHEAAMVGLALPHAPYWWGITIGGLLATGCHGSSLWGKGSAVHEYVVEVGIVSPAGPEDGYVKVRWLKDTDQDLNAAKVSLGVLGVISKVTLKLEPLFKRSITYTIKEDSDLGDQLLSFGQEHEFADITWQPAQHRAVYRIDDRVSINASGNGLYDYIPLRSTSSAILEAARTSEEIQESTGDADGKCSDAKLVTEALASRAYGLTNNGTTFTGYPVIGYNHRLQSAGSCIDDSEDSVCFWDTRVKGTFFHSTAISIPLSTVKNFIEDVKKLVELEPKAFCTLELNNGILMRYVKGSSAYLGKPEDSVDFDIIYYRSRDPMIPRLHGDILEEIEQIALFKYGGLPHWGKNRNLAFEGAIKKHKDAEKFLKVKMEYDSSGLFSNDWTDRVLGLKEGVMIEKEGCALDGLCVCSEDSHCAPSKGYFCREGRVYKEARVCTLVEVVETEEGGSDLKEEL
ncbi:putative L-gulonolactone oxidase 6 [Senna tora]|uniref:L-gulonolactone oxidase n=1 Tax=Senna tora TaxID=362788 RepID=A0A835CLY9_9FABA|nr:putative L-gulonolactone oxidase 6 [Senna tora]